MSWTRLVRFEADDGKVYLGQPVDESVDPGTAAAGSVECAIIEGSPFDGKVTSETKKAQKVSLSAAALLLGESAADTSGCSS